MTEKYRSTIFAFSSAAAEREELSKQHLAEMQRSTALIARSTDLLSKSIELRAAGKSRDADVNIATSEAWFKEAQGYSAHAETLRLASDQKHIEVVRLDAVLTAMQRTLTFDSYFLLAGQAFGAIIFAIGSARWLRAEKKPAIRRVSRRRGDRNSD